MVARAESFMVKVRNEDAHIPENWATEEHNNQQVDQTAKIKVAQVNLDLQCKGELFLARWAHETVILKVPLICSLRNKCTSLYSVRDIVTGYPSLNFSFRILEGFVSVH